MFEHPFLHVALFLALGVTLDPGSRTSHFETLVAVT